VPEGHTIHRAARDHQRLFGGATLSVSSPQGRFAASAATLDGSRLESVEAYGKHLFYWWEGARVVHVHLGLFGKFRVHRGDAPPPRGAVRLRLSAPAATVDLSGPTDCRLDGPELRDRIVARLGPDPLRPDADPERAIQRWRRSRAAIGTLLLDQSVIAGVGNVYRAEALFVCRIHPRREGRSLSEQDAVALWSTAASMLAAGVRLGRIVTVDAATAGRPPSRLPRREAVWVYKQAVCRRCGDAVERGELANRTVYACPTCQR
jgi:endonuclease-8